MCLLIANSQGTNGVSPVWLATFKTKVATTITSTSIPHLELMGPVIGNKLTQSVAGVLTVRKAFITFGLTV